MDGVAWAMLVALAVLWGGSFIFVEVILTELPVFTLVALRVALASVVLWAVVAASGTALPRGVNVWAAFLVMGVVNNAIPFSLIVWGQTEITAGLAAILNATTPLFAGLLAGVFLADEQLTAAKLAGLLLGLVGVVVMIGPDAVASLGAHIVAEIAVIGAALSYASAAVFGRRFRRLGVPPLALAAGQASASSLVLVPAALVIDAPLSLPTPSLPVALAVLGNAVLSTALAYILYFAVLARAGATNAALVTVLVPVVAVLAGAALLDEAVTAAQLAGMALIVAGLVVVDGRVLQRFGAPRSGPASR
jgi:drug/metabolite transporter (DMT)-like permease